jgi:hypothetical protein
MTKANKVCPECGHEFQGNGWEEAWPLISAGNYKPEGKPREHFGQAAADRRGSD